MDNTQDINHANISLSINQKETVDISNNENTDKSIDATTDATTDTIIDETIDAVKTTNIESILNNENANCKKEPWCKLDKTTKIKKIVTYVNNIVSKKYELTDAEIGKLEHYLIACLDKIKLQRVKDVDYKKDLGCIQGIPLLHFDNKTRKFTLKRGDKRANTLKSLSKPKKNKRSKKHDK